MRSRHALLLGLGLLAVIAGCASWRELNSGHSTAVQAGKAPSSRTAHFVPEEYAPYSGAGDAVITGQAFTKNSRGDVKFGAGDTVTLEPITSYSKEWWQRTALRGEDLEAADPRASAFTRVATADAEGRFKFDELPAGEYYVDCRITWEARSSTLKDAYMETQGVCVGKRIHVDTGESVDAVLVPVSTLDTVDGSGCAYARRGWIPTGQEPG